MNVMNFYYTEASNVYGMFVINALLNAKANSTNTHNYDGTGTNKLYYIDEYSNNIELCDTATELGQLLLETGTHVSVTGKFPNSFENYVKEYDDSGTYATMFTTLFGSISTDCSEWKSKGDTSSVNRSVGYVNLIKLMYLRDVYRSGWTPNATSTEGVQYIITMFKNDVCKGETKQCNSYPLSFQTKELRDLFYATFSTLITNCKDFI